MTAIAGAPVSIHDGFAIVIVGGLIKATIAGATAPAPWPQARDRTRR